MASIPIWQRLLALLAYLLPWSDGVVFGGYLFSLYPPLLMLKLPALPVMLVEQVVPFGGFLLFLVLYLGVVRNQKVPYYLRFHVLQAILVDIVLVVVSLAFNVLLSPLAGGFAVRTLNNTVFLAVLVLVLFAVVECLRGRQAEIPSLSEAVRTQLY
jgi:uncharacterized membrane protein